MKLMTFTDYSLRMLMYLAAGPASRATIGEIAASFGVSENHLVKVAHFLGQNGWLANVRGKGGGLELALPADQIRLGMVVRQTEGKAEMAACLGAASGDCVLAPVCRLRCILGDAIDAFYAVLDAYTLADLMANRDQLAPILFLERAA